MKQHWKNFLVNVIRVYNIIFETRKLEDIQNDYYANKWISKEEMQKMFEFEKVELVKLLTEKEVEHNLLLSNFNMNSLASYELLERRQQGKLKKPR